MRIALPCTDGVRPKLLFWIAFSMGPSMPRSQGWTRTMCGSGALILATPIVAAALSKSVLNPPALTEIDECAGQ